MRRSPLKHPLAVLRAFIGLSQKEMASLLDRSTPTIQSVELCKLPLSEDLAALIEERTGINSSWLLEGDPSTPMENQSGASYRLDDYELARARSSALPRELAENVSLPIALSMGLLIGERLAHILAAASEETPSKFQVAMFRAEEWLKEMEAKFPKDAASYLEFRSRVKVSIKYPDGGEREIGAPIAPSVKGKFEKNFRRSLSEKYGEEQANQIMEYAITTTPTVRPKSKERDTETKERPTTRSPHTKQDGGKTPKKK